MIVSANTNLFLYAANPDLPHHPAAHFATGHANFLTLRQLIEKTGEVGILSSTGSTAAPTPRWTFLLRRSSDNRPP